MPSLLRFFKKNTPFARAVLIVLLSSGPAVALGDAYHAKACRAYQGKLGDTRLHAAPKRVLIIPLLSRDPHTTETPRWSEQPARVLRDFYRQRFNSKVEVLREIWNWPDYYREMERLALDSPPFDRIVFISHGGYDGPVMKNAVFWSQYRVSGKHAELVQLSEAQPGLLNRMSIVYDVDKDPAFSGYVAGKLEDFASMKSGEIFRDLKDEEKRRRPLDQSCFDLYCGADKLAGSPERLRPYRLEICERTCREPLFEQTDSTELAPDRFLHFAKSLTAVLAEDGLIFFGSCNPGSAAASREPEDRDETELLINSSLAGGPHPSYVHLVSAATGRVTAGPIGKSSATDIINRVTMFENNRPQRNLCVAVPASR